MSHCLKLYCECFAGKRVCGSECNCNGCGNREGNENKIKEAMQHITVKNPISLIDKNNNVDITVGCKCKNSSCQQYYCFCYKKGLKCGNSCKCTECENKKPSKENGLGKPTPIFKIEIA